MTALPFMPLWTGDYFADTRSLTTEQHGAYLLILMTTWQDGGRPPPDNAATMCAVTGLSPTKWKSARDVLTPFFDLTHGDWRSARLLREWQKASQRASVATLNGRKGGRPAKPNVVKVGIP